LGALERERGARVSLDEVQRIAKPYLPKVVAATDVNIDALLEGLSPVVRSPSVATPNDLSRAELLLPRPWIARAWRGLLVRLARWLGFYELPPALPARSFERTPTPSTRARI
jgi:hypothetical protein